MVGKFYNFPYVMIDPEDALCPLYNPLLMSCTRFGQDLK